MDFHDFEKFNGQNIKDFVKTLNKGYATSEVEIDGVKVIEYWDSEFDSIDYRLPEEGYPCGHQLIGHAEARPNGDYIFEASDEEWY